MNGSTRKTREDDKKEDDGFQALREGILRNFSAMRRAEGRRRETIRRRAGGRSPTRSLGEGPPQMGYRVRRATSGWTATLTPCLPIREQDELQEDGLLRLPDGTAWKLSIDEEPSTVYQILSEDGQHAGYYWNLAGDILEKAGFDLGSRNNNEWPITAICQRCQSRVPLNELFTNTGIRAVGASRKRKEREDPVDIACRRCLFGSERNDDRGVDQPKYPEGTPSEAVAISHPRPSQSQQNTLCTSTGGAFGYNEDAGTGGLFRRVGGQHVRLGGVRRVGIHPTQPQIPEPILGWIEDEHPHQGLAEEKEAEHPSDHDNEFQSGRELLESQPYGSNYFYEPSSMGRITEANPCTTTLSCPEALGDNDTDDELEYTLNTIFAADGYDYIHPTDSSSQPFEFEWPAP